MSKRDCTMCGYYNTATESFQIGEADEAHLCPSCMADLGLNSLRAQLAAAKELARACEAWRDGKGSGENALLVGILGALRAFRALVPREEW